VTVTMFHVRLEIHEWFWNKSRKCLVWKNLRKCITYCTPVTHHRQY